MGPNLRLPCSQSAPNGHMTGFQPLTFFIDSLVITPPSVPVSSKWPSDALRLSVVTPLDRAQSLWFDHYNNYTNMRAENTKICDPKKGQNSWRIRTDDKLQVVCRKPNVVTTVTISRLYLYK
jgi:hypothetical protein